MGLLVSTQRGNYAFHPVSETQSHLLPVFRVFRRSRGSNPSALALVIAAKDDHWQMFMRHGRNRHWELHCVEGLEHADEICLYLRTEGFKQVTSTRIKMRLKATEGTADRELLRIRDALRAFQIGLVEANVISGAVLRELTVRVNASNKELLRVVAIQLAKNDIDFALDVEGKGVHAIDRFWTAPIPPVWRPLAESMGLIKPHAGFAPPALSYAQTLF